jgi:hypothetical protein
MTGDRKAHADQFYMLLDELAARLGGPRRLRDCTGADGWPSHGVYFFYEDGETRTGGSARIVRIGTHALTATSRASLWARLRQHRGRLASRNPGGGNHRASVFRRHVGAALIRRGEWPDGLLGVWLDRTRRPEWADEDARVEREVSRYIGAMPFLWLPVPDEPGGGSHRGYLESNSIALLSARAGTIDRPSTGWLGCDSPEAEIRESGLWNVHHVNALYQPEFLKILDSYVHPNR